MNVLRLKWRKSVIDRLVSKLMLLLLLLFFYKKNWPGWKPKTTEVHLIIGLRLHLRTRILRWLIGISAIRKSIKEVDRVFPIGHPPFKDFSIKSLRWIDSSDDCGSCNAIWRNSLVALSLVITEWNRAINAGNKRCNDGIICSLDLPANPRC